MLSPRPRASTLPAMTPTPATSLATVPAPSALKTSTAPPTVPTAPPSTPTVALPCKAHSQHAHNGRHPLTHHRNIDALSIRTNHLHKKLDLRSHGRQQLIHEHRPHRRRAHLGVLLLIAQQHGLHSLRQRHREVRLLHHTQHGEHQIGQQSENNLIAQKRLDILARWSATRRSFRLVRFG